MSKKKGLRPKITQAEGYTESGLPTPDQVDQVAEKITAYAHTPIKKSISAADLRTPPERAPGQTNKGRVKFTTMLRPDLRAQLETIAQNKAVSLADVLEIIVTEYLAALQK